MLTTYVRNFFLYRSIQDAYYKWNNYTALVSYSMRLQDHSLVFLVFLRDEMTHWILDLFGG